MKLKLQKRLASALLKSSAKRIKLDSARLNDITEAITKTDVRELISEGAIKESQKKGVSRARANKRKCQNRKGLRKGPGSRKGSPYSRIPRKQRWVSKVRTQRKFIKELKERQTIDTKTYRKFYNMVKGGFFRSKRHIKLFMEENNAKVK